MGVCVVKMDNVNPTISVILPTYNDAAYLQHSIDSILEQTFRDFELIVIDDGSTDGTQSVLDGYTDSRMVKLKNDSNKGLIFSLNRGLDAANGKYIARMDADDISYPKRLERQYEYMEKNRDITLCGCDFCVGHGYQRERVVHLPQASEELYVKLLHTSPLAHSSWMLRASDIKGSLYYDKRYYLAEDYQYLLELKKRNFKIGCVNEILQYYEDREGSVSKREAAANTYYEVRRNVLAEVGVSFSEDFLKKLGWGQGKKYMFYNVVFLPYYCAKVWGRNRKSKFFDNRALQKELMGELTPTSLRGFIKT